MLESVFKEMLVITKVHIVGLQEVQRATIICQEQAAASVLLHAVTVYVAEHQAVQVW